MFTGSIPREVVEQLLRVVPFDEHHHCWIACSGAFRFDRAVAARFPQLSVHSNDVSLYSCAIGNLLVGEPVDVHFTNELAFVEPLVPEDDDLGRVAAVIVALEMSRYSPNNDYGRTHFGFYRENFLDFLEKARKKLYSFCESSRIKSFYAGDFRDQADRAAKHGGIVVGFPPTYKGGYERIYRFLHANTLWREPDYEVWDPADIGPWIDSLEDRGIAHAVISDQKLEDRKPILEFYGATNKPVYAYGTARSTSLRRGRHGADAFRYNPVDPSALTASSTVQITSATGRQMNFLKDQYLAAHIDHTSCELNFLVYVDKMLVGGFIYARSKWTGGICLLSDFSISRDAKFSKLVAMIAASRDPVSLFERKTVTRVKLVQTTAFTDKPVSMKYRGIYTLNKRAPGYLNYSTPVRDQSPDEVYAEWWKRWGRRACEARHQDH